MSIGIYKITNKLNNKSYIGQSKNIEERWKEHISQNKDSVIHRAITKYGVENFNFEIIEECNINELDEKEIKWIKYYNSYENGYNCTRGGQGTRKYDNIEEIYQNYLKTQSIAATAHDLKMSAGTVRNILHIYNIYNTPNSEKVISKINPISLIVEKSYPSLREAAEECGCSVSNISLALTDKGKSAAGYFWEYYGENKDFSNYKLGKTKGVRVCQLDFETCQLLNIYETATEAAINITGKKSDNAGIVAACQGRRTNGFGFRWMYEEDYLKNLSNNFENVKKTEKKLWKQKVAQLDLKTGEIIQIFNSATEAAKYFNSTDISSIGKVCKGRRMSYKGYGWKYIAQ